jgi:signal transduction histidine kinase
VSVDIAAVAHDVIELERLGDSGVAWRLDHRDGQPLRALGQRDELKEVLLNLLENARLAHAQTVTVVVERGDDEAIIEVRDDGQGISAEVLPQVFEPHFSTRTSGSGLGLAISRRLIEGWGGRITLESVWGEGTVVRVALRIG